MIKSYRGLLAQDAMDTILLHTNTGSTGYRIVKFQLMPYIFGAGSGELESVVKIYKIPQSSATEFIDFSDNTLLAAATINNDSAADQYPSVLATVFDNEIFNQDIYITHKNQHADGASVSYYFELEQMNLDLNENTVATLKDIRNISRN
jgi:hypothetical protein